MSRPSFEEVRIAAVAGSLIANPETEEHAGRSSLPMLVDELDRQGCPEYASQVRAYLAENKDSLPATTYIERQGDRLVFRATESLPI